MPDQLRVSEVVSIPETLPFSSRLKLPVRLVRELVATTAWVSEITPAEKVYRMFGQDPRLPGLAILRDQRAVGLVSRSTLVERFSYRFSHDLFGSRPISAFMDSSPVTIEANTDLDAIGRKLQGDWLPGLMDDGFLIVDEHKKYVGIGTWPLLMKALSERREELFFFMAHHDPLTGLPNRIRFMEVLEESISLGHPGALFYLDLNRFKEVNDHHGHQEGDHLLNQFADRLQSAVSSDGLAARLGGDEFGVLLPGVHDAKGASLWISQFMKSLEEPCLVAGKPYPLSVSVGHCLYPVPGMGINDVLMEADSRMYRSKRNRDGQEDSLTLPHVQGRNGSLESPVPAVAVFDLQGNCVAQNDSWTRLECATVLRSGETDSRIPVHSSLEVALPPGFFLDSEQKLRIEFHFLGEGEEPNFQTRDNLTGVFDRTSLYTGISRAIREREMEGSGHLLLIVLDLDRFQRTNDIFGHRLGDGLLAAVASRLKGSVRDGDIVARLGGDEFAVVFSGVPSREDAERIADQLLHALSMPYRIDNQEYYLTASIGATLLPEDGASFESLVSNADLALSQAKDGGRFQVRFFDKSARKRQNDRYAIEQRLYRALERKEFHVFYQPVIEMATGQTLGAEALIRWVGGDGDSIPPDQFIPIAEENGMIVPIGEWVCQTVLADMARWRKGGRSPLRVAINLSARQMAEPGFLDRFLSFVDHSGENARHLTVELTETVIMLNPAEAISNMKALRERGIRIAVDDFGTGYSSLGQLRGFPVDILKIDRTFVRNIHTDEENAEIVRLIVLLARALELEICAEGVETKDERDFLQKLDVGSFQGYFASPALPFDSFLSWVESSMQDGTLSSRL